MSLQNRNRYINEDEMARLVEIFDGCATEADTLQSSFLSIRDELLNNIYDGDATSQVEANLNILHNEAIELYYLYDALSGFITDTTNKFKGVDEEAGNDAETLVDVTQRRESDR